MAQWRLVGGGLPERGGVNMTGVIAVGKSSHIYIHTYFSTHILGRTRGGLTSNQCVNGLKGLVPIDDRNPACTIENSQLLLGFKFRFYICQRY